MRKVKAAYSIRELSELTGLSRWQVHRMIARDDVQTIKLGDHLMVPLLAFRVAYPELWSSLVVAHSLQSSTPVECSVCGATSTLGRVG